MDGNFLTREGAEVLRFFDNMSELAHQAGSGQGVQTRVSCTSSPFSSLYQWPRRQLFPRLWKMEGHQPQCRPSDPASLVLPQGPHGCHGQQNHHRLQWTLPCTSCVLGSVLSAHSGDTRIRSIRCILLLCTLYQGRNGGTEG